MLLVGMLTYKPRTVWTNLCLVLLCINIPHLLDDLISCQVGYPSRCSVLAMVNSFESQLNRDVLPSSLETDECLLLLLISCTKFTADKKITTLLRGVFQGGNPKVIIKRVISLNLIKKKAIEDGWSKYFMRKNFYILL